MPGSGVFLWAWNAAAGTWVKVAVTPLGLLEVDIDNFPADYPLPAAQIADLQDVDVGNFPATFPLPAAQVTNLKKITEMPDPVISQPDPEALKHLPHAQVTGDGVYKPLQLDANDYLMVAIKALPHLIDITDIDVTALADDDILYWNEAASEWQNIALPSAAWADIAGKPDSPSLEEMAAEHEADGTHGAITPTGCTLKIDPTKEFFVPVTYGTEMSEHGYHAGAIVDATADEAFITFYVPHDFTSITSAVVVRLSMATATHRLNYNSMYGAQGEAYNTHAESLTDQDTAETDRYIYEQNIAGILSALAVGDYVGIRVRGDSTNTPNDLILGVRFRYS